MAMPNDKSMYFSSLDSTYSFEYWVCPVCVCVCDIIKENIIYTLTVAYLT